MLEVMISLVVTMVAVLSLMTSVVANNDLQNRSRESSLAAREITALHEEFRNGDLDALFQQYTAAPTFQTGALSVAVNFPEAVLVEQLGGAPPAGWRYRDVDADGQLDLDPAATATSSLLAVTVSVTWPDGNQVASFLVTER
jgi:hypothetical protein